VSTATQDAQDTQDRPRGYETNGINVISEAERKGTPRDLFWPWSAANISVLGLAYGAYVLGRQEDAPASEPAAAA